MSRTDSARLETSANQLTRTVLVVEDEVLVRMAIAEYLRDCGLHVVEAANGREAMTVLSEEGLVVDLVFSDVQMPEMGGFELAAWVHSNRPGLPIILASGDPAMADKARDVCAEGPLIPKPYDFALIGQRLRERLAALFARD